MSVLLASAASSTFLWPSVPLATTLRELTLRPPTAVHSRKSQDDQRK
jgi:hypothetical protein